MSGIAPRSLALSSFAGIKRREALSLPHIARKKGTLGSGKNVPRQLGPSRRVEAPIGGVVSFISTLGGDDKIR